MQALSEKTNLQSVKEATAMVRLIIYEESEKDGSVFETFELSSTRILIGSDPDNNLVLESSDIDPNHASLELRNEMWILQDLGGAGGTGVNGRLIQGPYKLRHNDLIEVGRIKMSFQEETPPPSIDSHPTPTKVRIEEPEPEPVRGRVWFAFVAGGTLAIIFVIMFLLIVADFFNVIEISDLFPLMVVFFA